MNLAPIAKLSADHLFGRIHEKVSIRWRRTGCLRRDGGELHPPTRVWSQDWRHQLSHGLKCICMFPPVMVIGSTVTGSTSVSTSSSVWCVAQSKTLRK